MELPPTIRVNFNFDDSLASLQAFLARWAAARVLDDQPAVVDLGDSQYLGPLAVSALGAMQLTRPKSSRLSLIPPGSPEALVGYCKWSGLLDLFGVGQPPKPHVDSVTTPLRTFSERPQSQMDEVVDLVRRTMAWPDAAVTRLQVALAELADNVLYHARSPIGGLLSARAFKRVGEVRFAVTDRGVGFGAALLQNGIKSANDVEAIETALKTDVTSRSSTHNLGQGLKTLAEIVTRNGGGLLLVSRGGCLDLHGGKRTFGNLPHPFPGTLALVRLRMGHGEAGEAVADVW